jgi:hypothetical protein
LIVTFPQRHFVSVARRLKISFDSAEDSLVAAPSGWRWEQSSLFGSDFETHHEHRWFPDAISVRSGRVEPLIEPVLQKNTRQARRVELSLGRDEEDTDKQDPLGPAQPRRQCMKRPPLTGRLAPVM